MLDTRWPRGWVRIAIGLGGLLWAGILQAKTCSDMQELLAQGKLEQAASLLNETAEPAVQQCAYYIAHTYYQAGEMNYARQWLAYAKHFVGPQLSMPLYLDTLYPNAQPGDADWQQLQAYAPERAAALARAKRGGDTAPEAPTRLATTLLNQHSFRDAEMASFFTDELLPQCERGQYREALYRLNSRRGATNDAVADVVLAGALIYELWGDDYHTQAHDSEAIRYYGLGGQTSPLYRAHFKAKILAILQKLSRSGATVKTGPHLAQWMLWDDQLRAQLGKAP